MKRAFTLIELILVVVIMGVVYMFAISSLDQIKAKSQEKLPTLLNLKSFLLAQDFEKEARLVCFEDCGRCSVVLDGKTVQNIDSFFTSPPKLYRYDATLGMEEIESDPFFDEDGIQKEVCFSYRIYKDGIGDQVLLEYGNKVYDYSNYFDDVTVYDSVDEAKRYKESLLHKVLL